jgi:hypothetical protein
MLKHRVLDYGAGVSKRGTQIAKLACEKKAILREYPIFKK